MAAELASAYISLIPSFRGGAGKIADELGPAAEKGGQDAGERAGKGASGKFGGAFSEGVKTAMGTAAAWGGASLLAGGFEQALDAANLPGKLSAQFGLAGPAAADAAKIAGDLYSQGWGESLGQVGESVGLVSRALQQLGTNEDVGKITAQAQGLSDVFGQDLPEVINAAGKLVKTGLAPNMQSALDVMAAGFQQIPEAAGDGLDTITEYSVQFQHLGLDAQTSMGLIAQAARAGARDTDFIADALKEFGIRAVDGSKLTADSFKSLGLDAKKMAADIGAGGTRASGALDVVLDKLRGVKDPVEQSQIAVGLFGTKAEDLQKALLALDPSSATKALGDVGGAAQKVADSLGTSAQAQVTTFARQLKTNVVDFIAKNVLPTLQSLVSWVSANKGWILPLIGGLLAAYAAFKIVTTAIAIMNAISAANPWVIIIAGLVLLATLIVTHWTQISAFLSAIWNGILSIATTVWNAITGFISGVLTWLRDFFVGIVTTYIDIYRTGWEFIAGIFTGALNGIKTGVQAALGWIADRWRDFSNVLSGIVGGIKRFLGSIWDGLVDGAKAVANGAISIINGLIDATNFAIKGLNHLPGVNIPLIPKIAKLAEGGIVDRPTLAQIGEGGQPEAVLPLSKLDSLLADRGAAPVILFDANGLERHLQAWLRQAVRVQGGGSVQGAFGRA